MRNVAAERREVLPAGAPEGLHAVARLPDSLHFRLARAGDLQLASAQARQHRPLPGSTAEQYWSRSALHAWRKLRTNPLAATSSASSLARQASPMASWFSLRHFRRAPLPSPASGQRRMASSLHGSAAWAGEAGDDQEHGGRRGRKGGGVVLLLERAMLHDCRSSDCSELKGRRPACGPRQAPATSGRSPAQGLSRLSPDCLPVVERRSTEVLEPGRRRDLADRDPQIGARQDAACGLYSKSPVLHAR